MEEIFLPYMLSGEQTLYQRYGPTTAGLCPAEQESRPLSCSTAGPGGPPTRENRELLGQEAVSSAAIEAETPPRATAAAPAGPQERPGPAGQPGRPAPDAPGDNAGPAPGPAGPLPLQRRTLLPSSAGLGPQPVRVDPPRRRRPRPPWASPCRSPPLPPLTGRRPDPTKPGLARPRSPAGTGPRAAHRPVYTRPRPPPTLLSRADPLPSRAGPLSTSGSATCTGLRPPPAWTSPPGPRGNTPSSRPSRRPLPMRPRRLVGTPPIPPRNRPRSRRAARKPPRR